MSASKSLCVTGKRPLIFGTNSSPQNVRECKTIKKDPRKFGLAIDQEWWPNRASCGMIQSIVFTSPNDHESRSYWPYIP